MARGKGQRIGQQEEEEEERGAVAELQRGGEQIVALQGGRGKRNKEDWAGSENGKEVGGASWKGS